MESKFSLFIQKSLECEDLFNMLILDVSHKDIYSSWDSANYSSIEDFKTESGKCVPAERSNAIVKLPSTLSFQLQRVSFDKEKGAYKINDVFEFEKELFVDRFLYMYKEKYRVVRERVRTLKHEANGIENLLQTISNFEESNVSLIDVLQLSSNFINKQTVENNPHEKNLSFVGKLEFDQDTLSKSVSVLRSYLAKVNENYNIHKEKLAALKANIEASYDEFRGSRYLLQSILMHEGSAESGHYFAYIFDFDRKVWRKFNDRIVTEEREEVVMRNAKGSGITSAYCLIYIREDMATFSPSPKLKEMSSAGLEPLYANFVKNNEELFKEVTTSNNAFRTQLEEFLLSKEVASVLDDYTLKIHILNDTTDKLKEKNKDKKLAPPFLLNFAIYLQTQNKGDLAKHHILSSLIKSKMFDENFENVFKDQLMRKILNLPQSLQTQIILPNSHEYHLFQKYYENDFICSRILLRSYEHLFSRDFYIGCLLIFYIMHLVSHSHLANQNRWKLQIQLFLQNLERYAKNAFFHCHRFRL